ncbi:MAG: hypothetical protein NTY46_13610 [Candidatus Sumerlaeota bacterium]|nr:hypothetical protein [Candidatus Sumerlaeota bacterium]
MEEVREHQPGNVVGDTIGRLRCGDAKTHGEITIIPLFGNGRTPAQVLTMDEALREQTLKVREISESGSVPELYLANEGDKPVLIIDGEELVGARQNRILNSTLLVAAGVHIKAPVSCCERGRWQSRSRHFGSKGNMAFMQLRKSAIHSVSHSLKCSGSHSSDQNLVWREIDKAMSVCPVSSPTSAMEHLYDTQTPQADAVVDALKPEPRQLGHVVITDGRVQGADVFHDSELYGKLHRKLVRSYTVARTKGDEACCVNSRDLAEQFLAIASRVRSEVHPGISLGRDHRIDTPVLLGAALEHDNEILFAEIFPND